MCEYVPPGLGLQCTTISPVECMSPVRSLESRLPWSHRPFLYGSVLCSRHLWHLFKRRRFGNHGGKYWTWTSKDNHSDREITHCAQGKLYGLLRALRFDWVHPLLRLLQLDHPGLLGVLARSNDLNSHLHHNRDGMYFGDWLLLLRLYVLVGSEGCETGFAFNAKYAELGGWKRAHVAGKHSKWQLDGKEGTTAQSKSSLKSRREAVVSIGALFSGSNATRATGWPGKAKVGLFGSDGRWWKWKWLVEESRWKY